jgi:hypothetical protein
METKVIKIIAEQEEHGVYYTDEGIRQLVSFLSCEIHFSILLSTLLLGIVFLVV